MLKEKLKMIIVRTFKMQTLAQWPYHSEEQILSSQAHVCGPNIPDKTVHTSPQQVHLHNTMKFKVEFNA